MEELYKKCSKTVYGYMYSLCGNSELARDLTQEVFLKAIESINRYNGNCKIAVWLCQIGKHLWYQYLAKNKKEIPAGDDIDFLVDEKRYVKSAEEMALIQNDICDVLEFISALHDNAKTVVILRLLYDFNFREIGIICEKSENWARVTYYRAKERIVKKWEERYGK